MKSKIQMSIITGKWKYATKVYVLPEYAYFIAICSYCDKKYPVQIYCDKDCDLHKLHRELGCPNDLYCSHTDDKQTMKMILDQIERQALGKQQPQLNSVLGLSKEGFAENSSKEWERKNKQMIQRRSKDK